MKHFSSQILCGHVDLTILEGAFTITEATSGTFGNIDGAGISSVSHAATGETGKYQVILDDKFNKCFGVIPTVVCSAFSNVAAIEVLSDDVAASGKFTLQCYDLSGAAVNPAASAVIRFAVLLRQSGVKGKGE
jgi:hypothetical protein